MPGKPQIERKLAAIMFTDIAGYTASMSKSESKTLNLLEKKRSILKPLLKEYKGTFVKEIGDGTLSYFESAVNAATCAVKLQEATYDDKEMNIRVGIHIGDIVFKDGDVFGGGVNVASRLESIAPAGGVCVSKSVYDELANQDNFDGIELGLQSLKGIGKLVEVFGLKGEKLNEPNPSEYQENKVAVHSDKEVPSIAIIPFDNKGADEDIFYAYGISADLISDVSSAGLIRVPSLKRVEEVADLSLDEKATKLDVRYTVEGTLWKMDDVFQLSVELYDTKNKKIVWSDRWQESWDNLPTIKGSLSDGLLKALDTTLKVKKKVDYSNSEAYEYYLKGKYKYEKQEYIDDTEIALGFFKKSIELDDNLIDAKNLLGHCYWRLKKLDKSMEIWCNTLNQAEKLRDKSGIGLNLKSIGSLWYVKGYYEKALDYLNRSFEIYKEIDNQSGVGRSFHWIGNVYMTMGDYDKALEYYTNSLSILEKTDDSRGLSSSFDLLGHIYKAQGEYDEALKYHTYAFEIRQKLGRKFWLSISYSNLGRIYYYTGEYKQAIEYLSKSIGIQKDIGAHRMLGDTTTLFISYKNVGKKINLNELETILKQTKINNISFEVKYKLYQLLEDTNYLKTAYSEIQEKADNLEPKVAAKLLSYPIPKAIVEEWEKVK